MGSNVRLKKVNCLKDRFTRGFIAGIIAWVPTFIVNHTVYYLHFATLRWSDFVGVLIYGKKPVTLLENLFAVGGTIFFEGLLGVGFMYLVTAITSKYCIFKGWVYGVGLWFAFYVGTVLFKVPYLTKIPLKTAFFNFIGATVWGLVLGITVNWIEVRWGQRDTVFNGNQIEKKESLKYRLVPQPSRKLEQRIKPVRLRKPKKIK